MKKTLGLSILIFAFVLSFVLGAIVFITPNTVKAESDSVAVVEMQEEIVLSGNIYTDNQVQDSLNVLNNLSASSAETQSDNSLLLVLIIAINIILAFLVVLNIFLSLGRKEQNFKNVETAEEIAQAVVNALNEQPKEEIIVPTAEEIAEELVKQGLVAKAQETPCEEVATTEEEVETEEVTEETEVVDEEEIEMEDETEEDESEDEEVEDGEESENDAFSRLSRKPSKTFEERLNEADDVTKENYNALKEELTSYKKVNSRISKKCESFRFGRKLLSKITIRGKSIKCFLALNPQDYDENRYHQKDASDKKAYLEVPFKMSVRSPRSLKRTTELIAEIANSLDLKKKV